MGPQIIRCSEGFKNRACLRLCFKGEWLTRVPRSGTLRITDLCETQNLVERAWLESRSEGLC